MSSASAASVLVLCTSCDGVMYLLCVALQTLLFYRVGHMVVTSHLLAFLQGENYKHNDCSPTMCLLTLAYAPLPVVGYSCVASAVGASYHPLMPLQLVLMLLLLAPWRST